jgi:hypothetical protein
MKRSVVVEFSHREAQIEAGKFDGIIYSESVERPELLSLVSEDLDEGKFRTDQQVLLNAGASTILQGLLAAIARLGSRRKDFCYQARIADDFECASITTIPTDRHIGTDTVKLTQLHIDV